MAFLKALVQPPARLRTLPDRWASLLRMLWIIVSLLSVAAVTLGTINALRDTYEVMPSFRAVDLDYDVEDNGEITVQRRTAPDVPGSGEKYRIASIDGTPVPKDIRAAALGKLLHANPSGFPGHRDLNLADPAASAGGRQSVKLERVTGL